MELKHNHPHLHIVRQTLTRHFMLKYTSQLVVTWVLEGPAKRNESKVAARRSCSAIIKYLNNHLYYPPALHIFFIHKCRSYRQACKKIVCLVCENIQRSGGLYNNHNFLLGWDSCYKLHSVGIGENIKIKSKQFVINILFLKFQWNKQLIFVLENRLLSKC